MEKYPGKPFRFLLFLIFLLLWVTLHLAEALKKLSLMYLYTLPFFGWLLIIGLFFGFVYWYWFSSMVGLLAYRRAYLMGAMISLLLFVSPLVLLSVLSLFRFPTPHPFGFVFDLSANLLYIAMPFGAAVGARRYNQNQFREY